MLAEGDVRCIRWFAALRGGPADGNPQRVRCREAAANVQIEGRAAFGASFSNAGLAPYTLCHMNNASANENFNLAFRIVCS